ncbi:hypothetical protein L596_019883 [Steinernema carpocapsae]|uniref:Uncharacterized protein n=1 Tax=Steinernema carpocapsae TaxID=34508 RepID=A0A4U5MRW3_STECR|nr:hypothetical protein L596_019883 [Steinernema carpocapsae]
MDTNLSQYDENENRCFSFFSPSNTIKTTTCNTTFFVMCRRDAKRQDTQAISLSKQLMNRRPGEARRTVAKGWKDALLLRTTWKPGKNAWKPGKNAPVVRIGGRKVGKKFERIDGSVVNRMAGRRSPFGGHLPHRNMGFLHLRMT